MFTSDYADVFKGDEQLARTCRTPSGDTFAWDDGVDVRRKPAVLRRHAGRAGAGHATSRGARVLAMLGDSVTTDHISPAGAIKTEQPGRRQYLTEHGVERKDFNSYGSRRGNHEVMIRGTFANIRLRNQLAPGTEGGFTRHLPDGEQMSIYDASRGTSAEGIPLIVLGGKEYGSGSSRDWAAKGTAAARRARGDRRVVRAHPPVEPDRHGRAAAAVPPGGDGGDPGPDRHRDLRHHAASRDKFRRRTERGDGHSRRQGQFRAVVRIDTPGEADYYRHGGIMQYVLRSLLQGIGDNAR